MAGGPRRAASRGVPMYAPQTQLSARAFQAYGRIRGCHATSALGLSSPVLCPPQPVPQAPYYTLVHLGGAGLLTATGVGSTCRGGTRSRGWHVWGAYGARVREHAGEITP
jgi:hypothetical protein